MAYDTKELEAKALEAIQKYKLIWIEEVVSYLPCSKPTFYEHKLNEIDTIKAAIEKNRNDLKIGLRKKWYESENATTQIALYKLTGTKMRVLVKNIRNNYIVINGSSHKPKFIV